MKIESIEDHLDGSATICVNLDQEELKSFAAEGILARLVSAAEKEVRPTIEELNSKVDDLRSTLSMIRRESNQVHIIEMARSALDES